MLSTTCHCGAVRIQIPHAPETITNCDCSICRRYGTLWAYYEASEVQVLAEHGATSSYSWGKKALRFVRCNTYGCIINWQFIKPEHGCRIGINARNFEPKQLGPVRIRRLDGAVTEEYLD
jgi:hypothetical protein